MIRAFKLWCLRRKARRLYAQAYPEYLDCGWGMADILTGGRTRRAREELEVVCRQIDELLERDQTAAPPN